MAFTFYYKSFIASQAEDAATNSYNNSNGNANNNNEDGNNNEDSNNNDDSYKILYNVINVADNVGLVAALGRLLHYGVPHYLYNALLPSPTPADVVCLPMPRLTIVCNFCALNLKDYFWLILQQNAARLLAEQWNTRAGRRLTEEASRLVWYGTTIAFGQVCWGT